MRSGRFLLGGESVLFQVKQTYDADDLWALCEVEGKRRRVGEGVVVYMQICALVGILVWVGALVGLVVWALTVFEGPAFVVILIVTFVSALFIPVDIMILARLAFSPREQINEDSLRGCTERTYTFYDDHFSIEDSNSTTESQYSVITKFFEKDDRFFLYISVNEAYIIRKDSFIFGTPGDFGPFMREKYRTKDMNTPEKGLDKA